MKRCSENMRQIYWRTNVRKCDMNNVGTAFRKNTFGGLFLAIQSIFTNSFQQEIKEREVKLASSKQTNKKR